MSMTVFRMIIDQSSSSPFVKPVIKLIGLGEPLLNPRIASMVRYAKRKGLEVTLVSNFALAKPKILEEFVEAQLDYLGVSMDSASPKVFEKIRVGAKFEDVVRNVKHVVKAKERMNSSRPLILFRTTIVEDNVKDTSAITEFAKSLDVDHVLFGNEIKSLKAAKGFSPLKLPVSEQSNSKEKRRAFTKSSVCPALRRCYITYDGRVLPCNYLMMMVPREEYASIEFGNINQNSLCSIWFSTKYRQFRVLKGLGYRFPFCSGCPLRTGS
jgi:radical SAM protein with 4Fe4S-binding SPASM domain